MAHPNLHAKSSAKKFGGKPEDYIHLHEWLDETKSWLAIHFIECGDIIVREYSKWKKDLEPSSKTQMGRQFIPAMLENNT